MRRFHSGARYVADAIYNEPAPPAGDWNLFDPDDPAQVHTLPADHPSEDVLVPVFRRGRPVYEPVPIETARRKTLDELGRLHDSVQRLAEPRPYPVYLEAGLFELKRDVREQAAYFRADADSQS